jgi:hypothetical protein
MNQTINLIEPTTRAFVEEVNKWDGNARLVTRKRSVSYDHDNNQRRNTDLL